MFHLLVALAGLVLGCFLSYYIFHRDADNNNGNLRPLDPTTIGFLALYALSTYYGYSQGMRDILAYSYACLYISMLLSIAFIDIKTGYLYDAMLGIYGLPLALLSALIDFDRLKSSLLSMLIVFLLYGLIYVLARLYYKREAFGTGDIFFVTIVAMNMQPFQAIVLAFMAFYIAAFYLLIKFVLGGKSGLSAEIAFCPYIAFAGLIMLLFEAKVTEILGFLLY